MRYAIWKRDDAFFAHDPDNIHVMDPAVCDISNPSEAIVYQYNWSSRPLGLISDIRLEDGEITGEATWFPTAVIDDEMMKELKLRLGGYYLGVEKIKEENWWRITKAELRAVCVVNPAPANPFFTG